MTEETKQVINLQLALLKTTLKETNTVVGIMIDKKNYNDSKLAFVDFESYMKGYRKDGFVISLDELNKETFNR
jgi:uncharacterized protein (DUF488 family)